MEMRRNARRSRGACLGQKAEQQASPCESGFPCLLANAARCQSRLDHPDRLVPKQGEGMLVAQHPPLGSELHHPLAVAKGTAMLWARETGSPSRIQTQLLG